MKKFSIYSILFISALSVLFVSNVSGAGRKYGMAGCGLGSFVISSNGTTQIFAATTNGTSGSQTFGITSGTSNCTADGIVQTEKEQEIFVHLNFDSLEREIVSGTGEKLTAFASLMGCSKNVREFASFAKTNYRTFATDENRNSPSLFLSALKLELAKDQVLSLACGKK